jgi:hypothetical protein
VQSTCTARFLLYSFARQIFRLAIVALTFISKNN